MNVAVVDPAGTVTDVGTRATVVVPLVRVTTTASVATPDNVTVPVLFVPPLTLVGFKVKWRMFVQTTVTRLLIRTGPISF